MVAQAVSYMKIGEETGLAAPRPGYHGEIYAHSAEYNIDGVSVDLPIIF
jgi:hypothetical protein